MSMNGAANGAQTLGESRPLKVVIFGAGIAGLSAAIFLRQQGHEVTVLEWSLAQILRCPSNCQGHLITSWDALLAVELHPIYCQ